MCGVARDDPLAVQFQHQAQRGMGGGMLRPEVQRPAVLAVVAGKVRGKLIGGQRLERVGHTGSPCSRHRDRLGGSIPLPLSGRSAHRHGHSRLRASGDYNGRESLVYIAPGRGAPAGPVTLPAARLRSPADLPNRNVSPFCEAAPLSGRAPRAACCSGRRKGCLNLDIF